MKLLRQYFRHVVEILEKRRCTYLHYKPYAVTVNIGMGCNQKCLYCPYHSPDWRDQWFALHERTQFAHDVLTREIDMLADWGAQQIHVCSIGEPFLHPYIYHLFRHIRMRDRRTSVLTNGTVPLDWDALRSMGLRNVKMDLDTLDDDRYEELCGVRLLHNVKQNIAAGINRDMKVVINTILMRDSMNELPDIAAYVSGCGVAVWYLTPLMLQPNIERGVLTKDNRDCTFDRRSKDRLMRSIAIAEAGDTKVVISPYALGMTERCAKPWHSMMLNIPSPGKTTIGNVVVGCTVAKSKDYPLGNVFDTPLNQIWNGQEMRRLRRNLLKNTDVECAKFCTHNRGPTAGC